MTTISLSTLIRNLVLSLVVAASLLGVQQSSLAHAASLIPTQTRLSAGYYMGYVPCSSPFPGGHPQYCPAYYISATATVTNQTPGQLPTGPVYIGINFPMPQRSTTPRSVIFGPLLVGGTYTISAGYPGDALHTGSTASPVTVTVP